MDIFFIVAGVLIGIILALYKFKRSNSNGSKSEYDTHQLSLDKLEDNSPADVSKQDNVTFEKIQAQGLLEKLNESANILNKTTNPETFFGRLGFMFDTLLELITYERYDIFSDKKPTDDYNKLVDNLEETVNSFIDRSYQAQIEKVAKLKTQKAKHDNMEKYIDHMVECFETADMFWTGNNTDSHYTGALFTEKNKKRVYDLYCCLDEYNEKEGLSLLDDNTPNSIIKTNKIVDNAIETNNTTWEISVSFSGSTSSNFERALYLAKNANRYEETEYNDKKIYQAFFSSEPKSYLAFIKLYELIAGWKSTTVMINGEMIDRKIVAGINRCYGDKCRTGKNDFCYGASYMTENPFGCHRLQISCCNHPWWSFSHYNGKNYTVDKRAILERAISYSTAYRMCPSFNWERILNAVENLPNTIEAEDYDLDNDDNACIDEGKLSNVEITEQQILRINSSDFCAEPLQKFDEMQERDLLNEYQKHKGGRASYEYFAALPLINFYYKYRDLDEKYLQLCIQYCNICISLLDAKDMQSCIESGIKIPAFQRLVIIFEKQGDYTKAIEIAEQAMKYDREKTYYEKKIEALNKKIKK